MLLPLYKLFDIPFTIYYFALVTKCYLDFFYKILDIIIVFYLVNIILSINVSCTLSNSGLYCDDHVIYCYKSVLLRCNHILLYQSLNSIWFLLNHPRFRTILFDVTISTSADSIYALNMLLLSLLFQFLLKCLFQQFSIILIFFLVPQYQWLLIWFCPSYLFSSLTTMLS